MSGIRALVLLPAACMALLAQTPSTIQANGSATISATPDQAQLSASVVTQGATAQDAAQQNATLTTAVIAALKQVLGSHGTVQTTAYSVSARYNNTGSAVIGYEASNTLQVVTTDLTLPGRLIDAATQAGANNVGSLSFGLQNPEPLAEQALTQASKQALAHAAAIASGLGAKTGAVLSAQEGSTYAPSPVAAGAPTVTTPVVTGLVTVSATVTVIVQLIALAQ